MGSDTMIGTMIGFMDNHFINKLLGRNTDFLYTDEAKALIKDKVVLVTGGGGSIGGEIVQQAINLGAKDVYCVDQDEFALYNLQLKLTGTALLTDERLILADIRNEAVVDKIFSEVEPDIVYHAAANKHLPLLERSPMAAFCTNVVGTTVIANACVKHAVKVFINISTDKAARPTSILGITKRIAEYITSDVSGSDTRVASVRFGNVLGSRGSFLPTLAWQIKNNQTVTVTHPDITRYFMTIPEAAPLGNFEIVLTCGDDIVENITLGANGYRDIELASGLVCTVVENDTRGAVLVSYSPSDTVTIATNQQQQIDVINDYRTDEPVEPEEPTEPEEPVDPVIPTCNQGVNLIENGSFENPVISQDADGWDVFDSVINGLAWIVSWLNPTAESPDVAKLELQNGFTASEGVQYAELDANFSSIGAEFEGEDSRVVISQSIATIPGYTYSVNFDFAAIPAIPDAEERNVNSLPENNRMNVLVDGEVIRTVEADGSNDDDANWTSYTVTFVATTETTEIAFADAGLVDTFGTWLDNVRVYCVGENGGGETPTEPTNPTPNRGGGGYTPGERPGSTPDGEVLGDSISLPEGEVLGDQVTVVPTGAPNTGAGGTNYYFVAAALALAAFATRRLQIN